MSLTYRLKSDTNVIQKKSVKKTKNHHFDNGFSFNKKIDHGFFGTTTTKQGVCENVPKMFHQKWNTENLAHQQKKAPSGS